MSEKFYNNSSDALAANDARPKTYISYYCPFAATNKACGSWCPLFELAEHTRGIDGAVQRRVCLRCGDGKKVFFVIEK